MNLFNSRDPQQTANDIVNAIVEPIAYVEQKQLNEDTIKEDAQKYRNEPNQKEFESAWNLDTLNYS